MASYVYSINPTSNSSNIQTNSHQNPKLQMTVDTISMRDKFTELVKEEISPVYVVDEETTSPIPILSPSVKSSSCVQVVVDRNPNSGVQSACVADDETTSLMSNLSPSMKFSASFSSSIDGNPNFGIMIYSGMNQRGILGPYPTYHFGPNQGFGPNGSAGPYQNWGSGIGYGHSAGFGPELFQTWAGLSSASQSSQRSAHFGLMVDLASTCQEVETWIPGATAHMTSDLSIVFGSVIFM